MWLCSHLAVAAATSSRHLLLFIFSLQKLLILLFDLEVRVLVNKVHPNSLLHNGSLVLAQPFASFFAGPNEVPVLHFICAMNQ